MFRILFDGKYVSVTKGWNKDFLVNAVYDAGSGLFAPHYEARRFSKSMTFLEVADFVACSRHCFSDVKDCLGLIAEGNVYSFPKPVPVRTRLSRICRIYGLSYDPTPRVVNPYRKY